MAKKPTKREVNARAKVCAAIRAGRLHRPDTCSKCGAKPPPYPSGKPVIEGHHADYDKPLDVEWLCLRCHKAVTPMVSCKGELQPAARLTDEAVEDIRSHRLTQAAFAELYGVAQRTVGQAQRRDMWKHLPGGDPHRDRRTWGKSPFKGVSPHVDGKWRAYIRVEGRNTHIGLFATEAQAAEAYNQFVTKHFGTARRLNDIAGAASSPAGRAALNTEQGMGSDEHGH